MNLPIKARCKNEKNLIKIFLDGLEIFVELSGDQMASPLFIDVLVKSSKSTFPTLQLINDHVLNKIDQLCSSAQSCQGVSFVHGVLRPKAMENLLLCKHRKDQALLLEDLKQELWGANLDPKYEHHGHKCKKCLKGVVITLKKAWKVQQCPFWAKRIPMTFGKDGKMNSWSLKFVSMHL
jgi:hypothetical protein